MAVTSAISDLFSSFYELLASILGAAYSVVHGLFMAVFNLVTGVINLVGDFVGGLINVTEGVAKFALGNFVILAIGAGAAFAYFRYTAQGRQVAAGKKTN